MNPQKRRQIYERFRAANPNPTTELKYRTPYELLVAVVLSAQATDKSVNQASAVLFEQFRSEEHTSELQSRLHLVCRLLLEKKKTQDIMRHGRPSASGIYLSH